MNDWTKNVDERITDARRAAIAAGRDQDAAAWYAAIAAVSSATRPIEAAAAYQTAAARLDCRRPRGIGGPAPLPGRVDGEDWTWARVDTRGTGNGGRWVATRPLTDRARSVRGTLMDTLARLMPGFNVRLLARRPLFWEAPVLDWMGTLSADEALRLGAAPAIESRRQADALERQGFRLPATSIPRTQAAIAMAAEAAGD